MSDNTVRQEGFDTLMQTLLAIGGDGVIEMYDPDLKENLSHGRSFDDIAATTDIPFPDIVNVMEPCKCHRNTAILYKHKPRRIIICTGWALAYDGLWRQHSWAVAKPYGSKVLNAMILETTVPRLRYYGVTFEGKKASDWAEEELSCF